MADGNTPAHEKGARLARFVGRQWALLVLDGFEPLTRSCRGDQVMRARRGTASW
jgi:hypothetical protein